jgi:hypothetical protein
MKKAIISSLILISVSLIAISYNAEEYITTKNTTSKFKHPELSKAEWMKELDLIVLRNGLDIEDGGVWQDSDNWEEFRLRGYSPYGAYFVSLGKSTKGQ